MLFRIYEKDFADDGVPKVARRELTWDEVLARLNDEHYRNGLTVLVIVPNNMDCHEQALAALEATF